MRAEPDIFDGFRDFDTTHATTEAGETAPEGSLGGSLWWAFRGPEWAARAYIGAGIDATEGIGVALYRDTDGGEVAFEDLELLGSSLGTGDAFSNVANGAMEPDETIYIQVYGDGGNAGPGTIVYWASAVNDDFEHAIALEPVSGGTTTGTNQFASTEPDEPDGVAPPPERTVWWSWTAPADTEVIFDTAGSEVDAVVDVFTGTDVATLSHVVDDAGPDAGVAFTPMSGEQYHVRLDAADAGALTLNWCQDDQYEPNDTVEDAAPIVSGEPVEGVLCDDADYFSIDADAGDTVTANLNWDPADGPMTLQLLDANGNVLDEVIDSETGSESVVHEVGHDGTHLLRVGATAAPRAMPYVLTSMVESAPDPTPPPEPDPTPTPSPNGART